MLACTARTLWKNHELFAVLYCLKRGFDGGDIRAAAVDRKCAEPGDQTIKKAASEQFFFCHNADGIFVAHGGGDHGRINDV